MTTLRTALLLLLLGVLSPLCALTRVPVQDFETGAAPSVVGEYWQPDSAVAFSTHAPASGKQCVRLHYSFAQVSGNQYLCIPLKTLVRAPIHAVVLAVNGDNSHCGLGFQVIDAHGETHQYQLGVVDFFGWRDLVVNTDLPHETWGGDNNRVIDYPLTGFTLVVHAPAETPTRGNLYFDNIRVDSERGAADTLPSDARFIVPVLDFETPDTLVTPWGVNAPADNTTTLGPPAAGGKQSLLLHYHFVSCKVEEYLGIPNKVCILSPVHKLIFSVFGDESRCGLGVQVYDASGETHQFRVGPVDFKGWKEFTLDLDAGHETWGGDKNNRMDYPLSGICFAVSAPPRKANGDFDVAQPEPVIDPEGPKDDHPKGPVQSVSGTLAFDNVRVASERSAEATVFAAPPRAKQALIDGLLFVYRPAVCDGYFWGKDTPAVTLSLVNPGQDAAKTPVAVRVADRHGADLGEVWHDAVSLEPGTTWGHDVPLKLTRYGVYTVTVSVGTETHTLPVSWLAAPATPWAESPFGVCTHWGRYPDPNAPFTTLRAMGASWIREGIGWNEVEPQAGQYTIPGNFLAVEKAAKTLDLHLLLIFAYGNRLYEDGMAPKTEAGRTAFTNYAKWVVANTRDYCRDFEIWNEPDNAFWAPRPNPDEYAALVRAAYPALKATPDGAKANIVCGCPSYFNWGFIDGILQGDVGHNLDTFSLHPYGLGGGSAEAGGLAEKTAQLNDKLAANGAAKRPVWYTEFGYVTQPIIGGVTQDKAAMFVVREYLLALAQPNVQRLFCYDFQDDGTDPRNNEHNFGMIAFDGAPKVAFAAFNTMARCLFRTTFGRTLPVGSNAQCDEFAGPGGKVLAAWAVDGAATLAFATTARSVTVTDLMGNATTVTPVKGRVTLPLTGEPCFVSGYGEATLADPLLSVGGSVTATCGTPAPVKLTVDPALAGMKWTLTVPDGWTLQPTDKPNAWTLLIPAATTQGGDYGIVATGENGLGMGAQVLVRDPLEIATGLTPDGNVTLTLKNPFTAPVAATYQLTLGTAETDPVPVTVPAGGAKTVELPVKPEADGGVRGVPVDITVAAGDAWRAYRRVIGGATPCYPLTAAVDGDLKEWDALPPCLLDASFQVVSIANSNWGGPADLSARVWLGYDTGSLFLAARVKDNQHTPATEAEAMWMADCLQLAFAVGDMRYEFGLGLAANGGTLVYQWSPDAPRIDGKIEAVARRVGDETLYEMRLPLDALHVVPGKTPLRFACLLNDNDGGGRRGWIEWFPGIGVGKNPALYSPVNFLPKK